MKIIRYSALVFFYKGEKVLVYWFVLGRLSPNGLLVGNHVHLLVRKLCGLILVKDINCFLSTL